MEVADIPAIPPLSEYRKVVGKEKIEALKERAERIKGLKLQEVNSTGYGGGVAEILPSYVQFLRALGLKDEWAVMDAEPAFFEATKTLHAFLQGTDGYSLTKAKTYWDTSSENLRLIENDSDVVTIHDPQPAGLELLLPDHLRRRKKMIWRCHIHLDVMGPHKLQRVDEFIRPMIERYDCAIFSTPTLLPLWAVPSFVIPPFIDPLSEKNIELTDEEVDRVRAKFDLSPDKPLITQVSRFDWAKDPMGVIQAFKLVKKKGPCQLLLAGGGARDDPEYQTVLNHVRDAAAGEADIHLLDLPPRSHREINALQRASQIIVQKSVREGFGLTVSEGLWKEKPVIGGKVGGIPLQIRDGWNGFLVSTIEQTADRILYLLKNPKVGEEMGKKGRQFVKDNFLLTRGVKDHLTAIDQLVNGKMVSRRTIISYHRWLGA